MDFQNLFVTGTDTGIGKTEVSLALVAQAKTSGLSVAGMKPVASGCRLTPEGLRNEDAERLRQAADPTLPYESINPYAFEPAVAPHLAADAVGRTIELSVIEQRYAELASRKDVVIVEGVGGWRVPLNREQGMDDLVRALQLPVVMVVGIRLGCINHALLSVQSIQAAGVTLSGWVANQGDDSTELPEQQIDTLSQRIEAPCLARIPYQPNPGILTIPPLYRGPKV